MKKLIIFLLAAVMLAALCACSGSRNEPDSAPGSRTVEASGEVIKMGTNATFPPYEFYDDTPEHNIIGIDPEIAGLIAEKLGMTLEIDNMEFDSILPAVQTGKVDFGMAGMTVNEDRLQNVNFTDSYAKGVQVVIVRSDSDITSVDDLFTEGRGYHVGVQNATTGDIYATWDLENKNLASVERFSRGSEAVQALVSGKLDCVIIDDGPAKAFVAANRGLKLLDTAYADEDYAICVAKNNDELLDRINAALDELIADGSVQKIVDKYIKN